MFFFPTGALQHAAAGFSHAGMTTEISSRVGRSQIPNFNIFADQIVDAAKFTIIPSYQVRLMVGTYLNQGASAAIFRVRRDSRIRERLEPWTQKRRCSPGIGDPRLFQS